MKLQTYACALFFGLTAASASFAATTTLNFDEFDHLTDIRNQYQPVGVTVSGVKAYDTRSTPWPANTGVYSAFSSPGLMTFTLDTAITGEIREVSGYLSGESAVGIYAYDANGNLVGEAVTATSAPANEFLTVVTSGAPIATVTVHDGGATFLLDTLSFATEVTAPPPPPPPVCSDVAQQLVGDLGAVPAADFKSAIKRRKLFEDAAKFGQLVDADVPDYRLRDQLYKIRKAANDDIKPSPERTKFLQTVEQLLAMVEAQQC